MVAAGPRVGRCTVAAVLAVWTVLLCLLFVLPGAAQAKESGETIRVAFFDQNGLSRLTEDGKREGYDYEYLQEIAQYTGWNYEFVDFRGNNEDILKAMEMVKEGELDLLTSIIYSEDLTEDYDFAAYSHGSVNTVLGVFDDNTSINEMNLFQNRKLRVAVPEKARTRIQELEQFCAMSKIEVETVPCASRAEQQAAVRDGRADVLLEIDLSLPEDMRIVARFAPRPFYFVSGKGKESMMSKLNAALLNINEIDPYFAVGLYEKYFGNVGSGLHLSEEEQTYVRGAGAIRVAVFPDRMPIQDVERETGEYVGVTREVFDYISESTGLQFQFVPLSSPDELPELLAAGTVELVAGMPYDYVTADEYGIVMSRPYMAAQTVYALAKGVEAGDLNGKRLALSKGGVYHGSLTDQVLEYDTPQQCLEALERGEADFAFNDNYTMQYVVNSGKYRNVTLVPQPGADQKLCIGLSRPVNAALLTILNKTIRSLSESDLQTMIYRNATAPVKVTFTSFVADNLWLVLGAILAAAILTIVLLIIYFRAHIRLSRREALENERYKQMGELTNEHIFEYSFKHDRIVLTERSAKILGVDRVREHYRFRLQQDRSPAAEKERAFTERVIKEKAGTDELNVTMPDGSQRWFRVAVKVISDGLGKPLLSVGRLTDIQKEREELERLSEKAQRDSLTSVYNGETIRQLATRRLQESVGGALLVLDVDEFKAINDTHGHFMGDRALIAVAQLLEDTFRRSDVVGRLGGDEFVVFVDRVTERTVVEGKCRQILAGMAELPSPLKELRLTVSIGAVMAQEGQDYNELYQLADKALYSVKATSRNGYQLT